MKILLYTDNHFCSTSSIVRGKGEEFSLRLDNQIKSINWAEEQADKYNCGMIIHLGDFMDKESLNSEEITALKEIKWSDKKHYFLVGNHEVNSVDLKYNSVNVLSKIGTIINKPMMDSGFGYELLFLPYIVESERKPLEEYIDEIYSDYWAGMFTTQEVKHRIILSHNVIKGVQYGGFESKVGFSIDEINTNCSLFINGHLHNQTWVNDKILNLGNLTGKNFTEDASIYSHYIGILDTDTLKVELVENPYAFNFYKLEYPFNIELKDNAIVSLKVRQAQLEEAKEKLYNNKKVIKSRITLIPELNIGETTISEIVSKDHIQQFKDYVLENIGCDDIIKEELGRL